MKRTFLSALAVACCLMLSASADELTRSVQTELKNQGFYYGEVTGLNSAETAAAIKRYQIRNGLEATGTLTKDTLEALGIKGATGPSSPPPALDPPKAQKSVPPAQRAQPTPSKERGPVDLRRGKTDRDSDREYVEQDQPSRNQPPPSAPPAVQGGGEYGRIFARTPYASAPLEVQESTVKKAQRFLRDQDFYRHDLDGRPGPDFEESLLQYQRYARLPLTGRLDLETLSVMRLLPGRGGAPVRPAPRSVAPGRPLRGVWID